MQDIITTYNDNITYTSTRSDDFSALPVKKSHSWFLSSIRAENRDRSLAAVLLRSKIYSPATCQAGEDGWPW